MTLIDSKPALQSSTVWAGIATILGTAANALGYHLSNTDISAIVNDVSLAVTAVSGLATIYFRIRATKTITPIGAKT